jgi:hypothetical protein
MPRVEVADMSLKAGMCRQMDMVVKEETASLALTQYFEEAVAVELV